MYVNVSMCVYVKYVNVSVLTDSLGPLLSSAIPVFHAFTGCDYTAAFARKGKLKPFVLLEKNKHFQNVFATLGKSESVEHEINKDIEMFVCTARKT